MSGNEKFDRRVFIELSAVVLAPILFGCGSDSSSGGNSMSDAGADADPGDAGSTGDAEPGDAGADADIPPDAAADAAPPADSRYGWDPNHDAGTTGDYYVDASVASSGDGKTIATAFKTISEAVAQSVEDGVSREIKVLAGIYRESFSLSGFQGRISGYGTDKPIVTGAEVLSGWTACTAADEAVVGPNYASIYKATLSSSDFASETPTGLNLYEDGEPLRLAQDRLGKVDLFFISYDDDFHRADSFGLDGSNQVTSITHAAVLTKYTSAQLSNAYAYLHHTPNTVSAVQITQVGSQGDTIEVDGSHEVQSTTDADRWRYSLANILPAMKAGQWGFSAAGDTVTVYAWPTSPSNLEGKIEYSARTFCINVAANMPGPITLEALDLRQPGGDGSDKEGVCIGTITSSLEKKQGLTVRHVRAGRTSNLHGGYGALYLSNIDDCTVENVTVEYTSGCFGIFLQGRTTDPMMRAKLSHFHARYTSNAGARFYGQFLCEFSYSLLEDNGFGGHTNQFNFYEQCDRCLVYGVRTRHCIGYATFQEASRMFFGCCEIAANLSADDSGRGLVDQQNSTSPPQTTCDNWVWNCQFLPRPEVPSTAANTVTLGSKSYPDMRWNLLNCIVHGGGVSAAYNNGVPSVEGTREGNVYTGAAFWNSSNYGWALADSEEMETDLEAVYVDAANEDFTPAAGSLILSHDGVDASAAVAAAQTHFPAFDFTKDIDGNTIDVASSKCGPRVDPSDRKP